MRGSYKIFGPVCYWTGPGKLVPLWLVVGSMSYRRAFWRVFLINRFVPLNDRCKPGSLVVWRTVGGETHRGMLTEWDNGTAIVDCLDGETRSA